MVEHFDLFILRKTDSKPATSSVNYASGWPGRLAKKASVPFKLEQNNTVATTICSEAHRQHRRAGTHTNAVTHRKAGGQARRQAGTENFMLGDSTVGKQCSTADRSPLNSTRVQLLFAAETSIATASTTCRTSTNGTEPNRLEWRPSNRELR